MTKWFLLLFITFALVGGAAAQDAPTGGTPWDLRDRDQAGEFIFYNTPTGASVVGQPLAAGDNFFRLKVIARDGSGWTQVRIRAYR